MGKIKLFHGSDHIIKQPVYLGGRADNDYGKGFYTTEYEERAYDACYLEGMLLAVRYLFRLLARNTKDAFGAIRDYMEGEFRSYMDMGNPLYLNKTPKQVMGSLGIPCTVKFEISQEYDEFILDWMADIYTFMQWKYNVPSKEIVGKIPPEELYRKFSPLHEASLENGVDKLWDSYWAAHSNDSG